MLCICGCGAPAPISQETDRSKGWIKGQPKKLIPGHRKPASFAGHRIEDRGFLTPCWIWTGTLRSGYGVALIGGKRTRMHRWYFERARGKIPAGLEPDHLCHQKDCVNPDHMEAVSHAQNVRRSKKHTILTMEKADVIRALRKQGALQREIAELFGVSQQTVSYIVNGKQWSQSDA